jgi:hypothetical protein
MAIETYCNQTINANLTLGSTDSFGKLIFDTSGFDIGEIEVGSYQAMWVDTQDGVFELMSDTSNQNHAITGRMGGEVELNYDGTTKLETKDYGILISGELNISTINNVSTDTDKFLVSDSGVIKYRTGAEVRTDIGAIGPATNQASQNPISGDIPVFVSGTTASEPGTIGNSILSQTTPYLSYSVLVNTGILDVRGTIKQSFTKESIYIGDNVGSSINTVSAFQDIYNIGIGNDVLKNFVHGIDNSGDQETGGDNVGVGYQAITNLTYGTNNVAIGTDTLKALTLGSNNIALGKNSLLALTGTRSNSLGNVALGFNTLSSMTTGDFNVAIGNTNLEAITSASSVVSIGNDVAKPFTGTITEAVLIGNKVLANSTATNVNDAIIIGQNSGLATSGTLTNDILIGRNSFNGNTSSGNNIAIGGSANQQNGTVDTSIAITTRDGLGTGGSASSFGIVISTYDDADTGVGSVNDSQGKYSATIGGIGNLNQGGNGFIGGGKTNTIVSTATNSAILGGFDNEVQSGGSGGMALGSNLQVNGNNQVVVGRYNTANNNTKFIVGAGFSNANRKNALEVLNTSQLRLGQYGVGAGNTGGTPNFPPTASEFGQSVLVVQANNLVYSAPIMGPTGVSSIGEYQRSTNLTCTNGGQTFLGPAAARFYKCNWSGTTATTHHEVRLPPAGQTASNNPGVTYRLIEFITDSTFDLSGATDGSIKFTPTQGETINGLTTGTTISGSYRCIKFWSDGTEWFILTQR